MDPKPLQDDWEILLRFLPAGWDFSTGIGFGGTSTPERRVAGRQSHPENRLNASRWEK
jgi:hypothetical protein